MVKIKNYRDIFLYFFEIGNMNKYLIWVYMTLVNGYKLDKYDPYQLV